jgi:hypothetical protein
MVGNRDRQLAFQIPLLIELAISSSPPESGRGRKSADLQTVRSNVLSFFAFTSEQRSLTRQNSSREYNVLNNEVDYAFDQLEDLAEVTRERERWEITNQGLQRLRNYMHQSLHQAAPDRLEELMALRSGDGPEWFIWLLRRMPIELLVHAAAQFDTRREMFLECIRIMPTSELHSFLVVCWEELRDFIGERLRAKYQDAISQLSQKPIDYSQIW